jgi:hypothetical protein
MMGSGVRVPSAAPLFFSEIFVCFQRLEWFGIERGPGIDPDSWIAHPLASSPMMKELRPVHQDDEIDPKIGEDASPPRGALPCFCPILNKISWQNLVQL